MIQFGTPLILWGALTALIPILIHLFGKRRTRRVAFSSLRFLQTLQQEQIRTLKLKQILLLILRTLFLLLLVLAFTNPRYAPSSARDIEHEAAVVVLDNTISSSAEKDGDTYLDKLKSVAEEIVNSRDAKRPVIWTSLMNPDSRYIQSAGDNHAGVLEQIQPANGHLDLGAYFQGLRHWLDSEGYDAVDLFLCTDGQQMQFSSLRDLNLSAWNGSRWYVVSPQVDLADAGISGITFPDELLQPGVPVTLGVTVTRTDSIAPMATTVQVIRDGERVGQTLVDWKNNIQHQSEFEIPVQESGFLQLRASLGEDEYEADNDWYLNAYVPERLNVVLVSNSPDSRYFLETALRSFAKTGSRIDFESISPGQLATSFSGTVDLIVLSDVLLNSQQKQMVQEYVQNGTGLMVFPGSYIRQQPNYRILPDLPAFGNFTSLGENNFLRVDQINWNHPVLANLSSEEQSNIRMPKVYQYFTLSSGKYESVMRLANGAPLLAEMADGNGSVWIWTVVPELSWSDLPRRGLFIPTLLRSLFYLSGNRIRYENLLTTGEPIRYTPKSNWSGSELNLITPTGKSVVLPVQTGQIDYTETDQPGQYTLYDGQEPMAQFSANIPAAERDMTSLGRAQWQVLLGDQFGDYLQPTGETLNLQSAGLARGTPLWQWLVALALLCLVAEMVLTRMDSPAEEDETELNG